MFGNVFGKLKSKALKKLVEKQMGNLPKEQQEMVLKMVEENPELFKKIDKEIKDLVKNGGNEMYASIQVMKKYQGELQKLANQGR